MSDSQLIPFDALLLVSFGGPEKKEDVMPFLENVTRGRRIPRERLLEVAEHYYHYDGISPINQQCRDLIEALKPALTSRGIDLPIYWGNRNWHPLLPDTIREMRDVGTQRALAILTSGFSSYSGCRQYRENITDALAKVGEGAPVVEKLRGFFNHPKFISANIVRMKEALAKFSDDEQQKLQLFYTAHSIPDSMAENCEYEQQLQEACQLVAEGAELSSDQWRLVYQSRSGRPTDPWLEPDICDALREQHSQGLKNVIVFPIGFLSDHMEVLFDLDEEAADLCNELGIRMVRAATVGVHPDFIAALCDLVEERISGREERAVVGKLPPLPDQCPVDCCKYEIPRRPA